MVELNRGAGPDFPLAGCRVGVTAARRAGELVELLERRGARVLHGPAMRQVPVADDAELLAATGAVLADPVDSVVVMTGVGFTGWLGAAEGWGLGEKLRAGLAGASLLARGPKARGAIRGAGFAEDWSPESETSAELLAHLLAGGVAGRRVAVQLHGDPMDDFRAALRQAGATVLPVPVYRWAPPDDPAPLDELVDAVVSGTVDAVTFTAAPAVSGVLDRARATGRGPALVAALRGPVLASCVGPVCAAGLDAVGVPSIHPERARLAAMVRQLADVLPGRRGIGRGGPG